MLVMLVGAPVLMALHAYYWVGERAYAHNKKQAVWAGLLTFVLVIIWMFPETFTGYTAGELWDVFVFTGEQPQWMQVINIFVVIGFSFLVDGGVAYVIVAGIFMYFIGPFGAVFLTMFVSGQWL